MSWNIDTIGPVAIPQLEQALTNVTVHGNTASPEVEDQLVAAKHAALVLAHSGAVGDPASARVTVYFGGHGNPGHAPTPGWANDAIWVNISQAAPEPEPTPDPAPVLEAATELTVEPVTQ